jgi:hypothetical protein
LYNESHGKQTFEKQQKIEEYETEAFPEHCRHFDAIDQYQRMKDDKEVCND